MFASSLPRRYWFVAAAIMIVLSLGAAKATADLNPAAISIQLPNQIKWVDGGNGALNATLYGDPSKEGLYIILTRWTPHHMSRPHYHQHDRFITVLSGTWWVGTGAKYDPDSTVALPTGRYFRHFGKLIHYDGAKDQEVTLEIVGVGPQTPVPAETK